MQILLQEVAIPFEEMQILLQEVAVPFEEVPAPLAL
jgi:hypothetical protein